MGWLILESGIDEKRENRALNIGFAVAGPRLQKKNERSLLWI